MDTLKKLSIASKAAFFAHKILLLTSLGTVLTASPGWATGIKPSSMTVSVPAGSNNGTRDGKSAATAFIDDILLDTITFGGVTFQSQNSAFKAAQRVEVTSGAGQINAEYGDSDTGSDGNPNPFVSGGIVSEGASLPNITRESADSTIQDSAIEAAFSSLSLSQGVDGEGPDYSFNLIFQQGIVDNSTAVDQVPELIFFERGVNSDFSVQAITGGTLANPTFAPNTVKFLRSDLQPTGVYIDTIEITNGQQLGAVGIDLNDFGLSAAEAIYGIRLTSLKSSGADMYGQFVSAQDPSQFKNVPSKLSGTPVPEPLTIFGSSTLR